MTKQTIENLENVQKNAENLKALVVQLSQKLEVVTSTDLSAIKQRLEARPVINREYIVTAQMGDKVTSNKVSLNTIDEFSLAFQFNKLARHFYRNGEVHELFGRDEGYKVLMVNDSQDIVSLRDLVTADDFTVVEINAEHLLLVDSDNDATSFNSYSANESITEDRLKSASVIVTALPVKTSHVSVDDSFIEEVEDNICELEDSLSNVKDYIESAFEELNDLETSYDKLANG